MTQLLNEATAAAAAQAAAATAPAAAQAGAVTEAPPAPVKSAGVGGAMAAPAMEKVTAGDEAAVPAPLPAPAAIDKDWENMTEEETTAATLLGWESAEVPPAPPRLTRARA